MNSQMNFLNVSWILFLERVSYSDFSQANSSVVCLIHLFTFPRAKQSWENLWNWTFYFGFWIRGENSFSNYILPLLSSSSTNPKLSPQFTSFFFFFLFFFLCTQYFRIIFIIFFASLFLWAINKLDQSLFQWILSQSISEVISKITLSWIPNARFIVRSAMGNSFLCGWMNSQLT